MKPELRKRLVDSIEYLRKLCFFQDYSNLSSEEILDMIFSGKIDYSIFWFDVDLSGEECAKIRGESGSATHGVLLKKSIEKNEDLWLGKSDASIDYRLVCFDTKRVMAHEAETDPIKGAGVGLIKGLAKISRGIFQPVILGEELNKNEENPPKVEGWHDKRMWSSFTVRFKYRGEEHSVKIFFYKDFLYNTFVWDINRIIKDIGYQYYDVPASDLHITIVMLTEDEAERLRKERGWEIYRQ